MHIYKYEYVRWRRRHCSLRQNWNIFFFFYHGPVDTTQLTRRWRRWRRRRRQRQRLRDICYYLPVNSGNRMFTRQFALIIRKKIVYILLCCFAEGIFFFFPFATCAWTGHVFRVVLDDFLGLPVTFTASQTLVDTLHNGRLWWSSYFWLRLRDRRRNCTALQDPEF